MKRDIPKIVAISLAFWAGAGVPFGISLADSPQNAVTVVPAFVIGEETRDRAKEEARLDLFQPYYDSEKEVSVVWKHKAKTPSILTLRDDAGRVLSALALGDDFVGTAAVDIASVPVGRYQLGLGGAGREPEVIAGFEKLAMPPVRRRVTVDGAGVTHVDGEVFVPQCLYRVRPEQWKTVLVGTGFNTVHDMGVGAGRFRRINGEPIVWTTTLEAIEADLDLAESLGLKVMFELGVYVKEVFEVEPGEEDGRRLREVVSRFRRHPALLGYYLVDEPYAPQVARVRRAREMIRRLDPDHPTLAPSLGRAFYYKPTSELCDIFMLSCYPVPYLPIGEVGRRLDQARSMIGSDKPMWFVAQTVGLRGNDWFPTPAEARCMVFQALTRGVSGFFYFSWIGDQPHQSGPIASSNPVFWEALKALTHELHDIAPRWLAGRPLSIAVEGARAVDVSAREVDGEIWVLAVNPNPQSASLRIATDSSLVWRARQGEGWREGDFARAEYEETIEGHGVRIWAGAGKIPGNISATIRTKSVAESVGVLFNGSFEAAADSGWELQGDAKIVEHNAFLGSRCLELTAPAGRSFARSSSFAVKPGQEILFSFHVAVDGNARGVTVDAAVEIERADGSLIEQMPLVGPDERIAVAMDWDWMGRSLMMPKGAVQARMVLGTRDNPGRTRYDAAQAEDFEQLRVRLGRATVAEGQDAAQTGGAK